MKTALVETYTAFLMGAMLGGLKNALKDANIAKANWTATGSEAYFEFNGQMYQVKITPAELVGK